MLPAYLLQRIPATKSILTTICLVTIGLFLISCGSETDATHREDTADAQPTEHTEHKAEAAPAEHSSNGEGGDHTHAVPGNNLVLNEGRKWQMDDHTRLSFAKMAESFRDVDASTLDTDELKQAGDGLRNDLDELIKGCTMTGPDHDQLHVYLMAFIPAMTTLQESGQLNDAQEVQHLLAIYEDYFE